jgi:hypothetical protein
LPPASAPTLRFTPKPSRALGRVLALLHLLAGIAACANPLFLWVKIVLLVAVFASFRLYFSTAGVRPSIVSLRWRKQQPWLLGLPNGAEIEAELSSNTWVSAGFILMQWRGGGSLLLCRDSLTPEEFRQLRVLLRAET